MILFGFIDARRAGGTASPPWGFNYARKKCTAAGTKSEMEAAIVNGTSIEIIKSIAKCMKMQGKCEEHARETKGK